jgi:hypothetical protein
MKRIDLTGVKKGRLTVLGYSHSHIQPSGQKRAMWKVVCDCGNEKILSATTFTHGTTISCGCRKKEGLRKLPFGQASLNHKFNMYRHDAKARNLTFELTKDEFADLTGRNCNYCGVEGYSKTKARPTSNGAYLSNGIDRVDSTKGYVIWNCVPCCPICNKMKLNLPYQQFIDHVKRILDHAPHSFLNPQGAES